MLFGRVLFTVRYSCSPRIYDTLIVFVNCNNNDDNNNTVWPVCGLLPCFFSFMTPLSSDRQHMSYDVCLEVRGEIIIVGWVT